MNVTKIKNKIKEIFLVSGYTRTAKILIQLNDSQLADIGISRKLLMRGASAYPWRETEVKIEIPNNVTNLNNNKILEATPIMPRRPKAA